MEVVEFVYKLTIKGSLCKVVLYTIVCRRVFMGLNKPTSFDKTKFPISIN